MRATFSAETAPNKSSWCPPSASHVIQRVDEAEVRVLLVLFHDGGVGRLDVEVGDVVGEDRDLVGVKLLQVLVAELFGLATEMLDQFRNEGAGAGGGVEDFNIAVDQRFAEVLLARASRRSRS